MPTSKSTYKKDKFQWMSYHRAMTKRGLSLSFQTNLEYTLAKDHFTATTFDNYKALAFAFRDRVVERWIKTQQGYYERNVKRVYYLSLEFLIGRLLADYMYNLGLEKQTHEALQEMGFNFQEIAEQEHDAGLGNGGLGRLAACFLESMATLKIPAYGYGIRYEYGIFQQQIRDGYQVELPDEWLKFGCPWEIPRPEYTIKVKFYGRVEKRKDINGKETHQWVDGEDVLAVPYDIPILGYRNDVVNTLRLWSARSTEQFDLSYFNDGDYEKAVYQKIFSENISKILYPNDSVSQGRELRLKQEYFFTAASIADILRRYKVGNMDLSKLSDKVAIQLNDTHPSLSIVELMRILVDEKSFPWNKAWEITQNTFAYTNHTVMPEALETWSVDLLEKILPRHLQIIYQINEKFLNKILVQYPDDIERVQKMSLIQEGQPKRVRMANVSIVGSHSVNGVSQLHTKLLERDLFKEFYEYYPDKFNAKTNGITQRRWLLKSNPRLSGLITNVIGEKWVKHLDKVKKILRYKEDPAFRGQWQRIKSENKNELSHYIAKQMNVAVDPDAIFDVQIKRIHEYKRQLLFAFYIISQYLTIKNDCNHSAVPRVCIIAGKAAPGYAMAKLIIKFINNVANVINNDKDVCQKLRLVFLENYRVSLAEKIFPASDLSEQISTAGTEASGTGNMKFMLNGALTMGTLDGANIEIAEQVGKENMFIFGLNTDEVDQLNASGYVPKSYIEQSPMLSEIYTLMLKNFFCYDQPGLFDPIIETAFHHDHYKICADFDSYCQMQSEASNNYLDQDDWTKKSIINVANSGIFSSDRTIREYAQDIWNVPCAE